VDRHWHMVAANAAIAPLMQEVDEAALLVPPVNVLRLSLHPRGLAPRIANLPEWRGHLLERLRRQVATSADPALLSLFAELAAFDVSPTGSAAVSTAATHSLGDIAVPLQLETAQGRLSLISTTTVFGTPTEITLSELAIEAFYPADDVTAERLKRLSRA